MKRCNLFKSLSIVMMGVALLMVATPAEAQSKVGKRGARKSVTQAPLSPTSLEVRERTVKDLLYFPFGGLTGRMDSYETVQQRLMDTFEACERINGCPGLHCRGAYDYTYRGVPIGLAFFDWADNRMWYHFYFDSQADAKRFYNALAQDINGAGIPLRTDKVYGGLSNRNHPVGIFKWVYVNEPVKVKEADGSNINGQDVVGMYEVEMGVYKK
ncbi:MAG: hypothetical protein IKX22_12400 [Prevotella sp.]|nr:hypothetical protein [Prevotella sp.]